MLDIPRFRETRERGTFVIPRGTVYIPRFRVIRIEGTVVVPRGMLGIPRVCKA